jgi:hypothetical protein
MNARYKHDDPSHLEFGRSADSNLLAKKHPQGYAKGGPVQKFARGGSAFANPDKYPGWPQMAGTSGPYHQGEVISADEAAATGNPEGHPVFYKAGIYT